MPVHSGIGITWRNTAGMEVDYQVAVRIENPTLRCQLVFCLGSQVGQCSCPPLQEGREYGTVPKSHAVVPLVE